MNRILICLFQIVKSIRGYSGTQGRNQDLFGGGIAANEHSLVLRMGRLRMDG